MQPVDTIDNELQSSGSLYRQDNQFHSMTDTKAEDPKSLIRIGQANEHLRALPPQTSGFYKYVFQCLFNIFRQWHVIYFIVFIVAKTFFLCNFHVDALVSELFLIVTYLVLQIYLRYKTYSSYILTEQRLKGNNFQVWSKQEESWVNTPYSNLKPGQVVKVKSSVENDNVVNPVNLLPIYLPSKKSHFQLKTTKINKFQQIKEIPLFHVFKRIVTEQNLSRQAVEQLGRIKIFFEYTIQNRNVFQGRLKVGDNESFYISNRLILPEKVPIINEDFIIGVVLINSSNINEKSLKRALNAENQTMVKTGQTLMPVTVFFVFIATVTFIVEFLLMYTIKINQNNRSRSQVYVDITFLYLLMPGFRHNISNQVNLDKQKVISFHRLRDSYVLNNKNQMLIKNHIKSIDEFGQTNTIIMDDYFFIDKNLFEVEDMLCNTYTDFKFDEELIHVIIEKSELLKEEMYDLWISTLRYFRGRPRRYTKTQVKYNTHIIEEKIFKQSLRSSTITLAVQINAVSEWSDNSLKTEKYVLRFREKPKLTTIQNIKNQKLKHNAKQLIKKKDLLHIMVQVTQLASTISQESQQNSQILSRNYDLHKYQFLALISHKINSSPYVFSLSLIKNPEIVKKQNIIILSNKKWKYIELILQKTKINTGHTVCLQEKDFQFIKHDIESHIRYLKEINTKDTIIEKHAILAIHCSLVTHLTSPEIIVGLIRLSRYCKYIIFHSCSQYEKEICCVNLFDIFPLHIYMSNYLCDIQLIEKSNLSVCEKGESTEPYVTLVVKTYKDLQYLILNEAVESINITLFIINSFLFKNSILIISIILAEFMLYEGHYFQLGVQYTGVIFLVYNIATSMPVVYYIFFRPEVWEQPIYKNNDPNKLSMLQHLTDRKVVNEFFRALFIAVILTILNYSFLQSNLIQNLSFSILTSCVVASGYYQLSIDDALKKKVQVVIFLVMNILFYMFIYFLQLWNLYDFHLVLIETNLTSKDTVYFFLSNIIVVPFVLGLLFYSMSVFNAKIQFQNSHPPQLTSEQSSMLQIAAKTNPQYGKQLHFRQF